MDEVYAICKDIKVCDESMEPPKQEDPNARPWIPHGGCGQEQPKISRDGLNLKAQFSTKPGEGMIDSGGDLTPAKVGN